MNAYAMHCMSPNGSGGDDRGSDSRLKTAPSMSHEDDDRTAPTDAASPPSSPDAAAVVIPAAPRTPTGVGEAPKTTPPPPRTQAELDAEAEAIRASLTPAGIAKVAADKLIEMYQYSRQRDFNLLDPEGQLAAQQRRLLIGFKTEVVSELSVVVRDITGAAVAKLTEQMAGLARGQTKHGEDIETLKVTVGKLTEQAEEFRKALARAVERIVELEKQDANAPAPGPESPPA